MADAYHNARYKIGAPYRADAGACPPGGAMKAEPKAFVISGMHHHAFRSCDIENTRAFYEEILGLQLIGTYIETENPLYKDAPS